MNHITSAALILFLYSCSTQPGKSGEKVEVLETQYREQIDSAKYLIDKGAFTGRIEKLDVSYDAIACPCANWFEAKNANKEGDLKEHFYLEPSDPSLIQADTLFNGEFLPVRILVSGQFYRKQGYPKNYFPTKGDPKPARVFCYNKIEIIQIGQPAAKKNGLESGLGNISLLSYVIEFERRCNYDPAVAKLLSVSSDQEILP